MVECGLVGLSVVFEIIIYIIFFTNFFGEPRYSSVVMTLSYLAAAVVSYYLSIAQPGGFVRSAGYFLVIWGLALCYRGQAIIKILLPFLFQAISIMVERCYAVILMPLHNMLLAYGGRGEELYFFIGLILSNLTILLLVKLLCSWKARGYMKQQKVYIPFYFALLLCFPLGVMFIINQYCILLAEWGKINFVMMLPLVFLTVITIVFFFMFDFLIRYQQEQQAVENLKWQLEQQRQYHGILLEKHQQFQGLRHDMKEHFTAIASLIKMEQYDKAQSYAEKQVGKLDLTAVVQTGDPLLDTILTIKADAAQKLGVVFQCYVFAKLQTTPIEPDDLASLFSNILNNALEAAAQVPDEQRRQITCKLIQEGAYLHITVANTVSHDVVIKNDRLSTTKADSALHGYGLQLIRQIVEKYEGTYALSCQNKLFTITVFLPTKC